MTLIKVAPTLDQEVDLTRTYDAVIVGSGAAGGMAAHVLTELGLKVLLLEAGKKYSIPEMHAELRPMQWPYEHPRRGDLPAGHHVLNVDEDANREPPYAQDSP